MTCNDLRGAVSQKIELFNKRKVRVVRGMGVLEDQKVTTKHNNIRTAQYDWSSQSNG
jgi:hypothetical protein